MCLDFKNRICFAILCPLTLLSFKYAHYIVQGNEFKVKIKEKQSACIIYSKPACLFNFSNKYCGAQSGELFVSIKFAQFDMRRKISRVACRFSNRVQQVWNKVGETKLKL